MLTARSLTKHFGTAPALAGVDFGVGPGESVAVTGPSGSGKSTLLHCLAGIMRPDSGEVRLFDERIDTLSERQRSHLRRTRFAFLFQFGQLLPELPAEENVALPLMLGGPAAQGRARAGRARNCGGSAWRARRAAAPASCREARRSGSRWPGPWSCVRRWCSPTSRPVRSTVRPATR